MEPNDALALEYQSDYGTAGRDLNVFDLVNKPGANGKCRVLGLSLPEEWGDLLGVEARPLRDDLPDALLIREEPIEPLP